MPRAFDSVSNMDDFFDQLDQVKQNNLNYLRNSTVDAPKQPVVPQVKNPNTMQDFKEELEANKQIRTESQSAYNKLREKRAVEQTIPLLIGGYIVYKFFL